MVVGFGVRLGVRLGFRLRFGLAFRFGSGSGALRVRGAGGSIGAGARAGAGTATGVGTAAGRAWRTGRQARPEHDEGDDGGEHEQSQDVDPADAAQGRIGAHACSRRPRIGLSPCYRAPPLATPGDDTMAAPEPVYDLMLLLDTAADADRRSEILSNVEKAIDAGGTVIGKHDWGVRATAYEIRHKTDADYHLLQFHGTAELLAELQRTLRITDGVAALPDHQARARHPAAAPPRAGDRRGRGSRARLARPRDGRDRHARARLARRA